MSESTETREWDGVVPGGAPVPVLGDRHLLEADSVDPDLGPVPQPGRSRSWVQELPTLGVISAGGVCGALARYGLADAWPHPATGFPWATFVINVSGCALIGVLMVIVTQVVARWWVRPLLGIGVLGGFTTFSTYVVDVHRAAAAGAAGIALAYLAVTLLGAMLAVWAGAGITGVLVSRRRLRASREHGSRGGGVVRGGR